MNDAGEATEAVLLTEYQSAYAAVLHYDGFRWSAGSMLVAGAFIFLGFIFSNSSNTELYGRFAFEGGVI